MPILFFAPFFLHQEMFFPILDKVLLKITARIQSCANISKLAARIQSARIQVPRENNGARKLIHLRYILWKELVKCYWNPPSKMDKKKS